jgi:phosphonate transport system substrate-binding protein
MNRTGLKACLVTACWILVGLTWNQSSWGVELRIGTVTEFPDEDLSQFETMAQYLQAGLQKQLPDAKVDRVKVVLPSSLRSMGYLVERGKVDLIFASPLSMVAIGQFSGLNFLLRQWADAVAEYHSVVFVRKDTVFAKVTELKGVSIAMEDPYSSSGYWIPKYYLTQEGLSFVRVHRAGEKPLADQTGYAFTYSDDLALDWVQRSLIKAGAVSNIIFAKLAGKYPDLKILYQSPSFYRQIVAYRPDLNPLIRDKIRELLLNMDQDPKGREVLAKFYQTTRFDEFPEGAEAYEKSLEHFAPFLRKELGLKVAR